MKIIFCPKGQLTKIISNFGRGYPQTFNIKIKSEKDGKISGKYIEKRYFWIVPEAPIEGDLKQNMQFKRYWINGIYSVAIKPDNDVTVEVA